MAPKRKLQKTDSEPANDTSKKAKLSTDAQDSKTKSEAKNFNLKIISWNVSGVRAWIKKDGLSIFKEDPDIICFQEIKCSEKKFPEAFDKYKTNYHSYIYSDVPNAGRGLVTLDKRMDWDSLVENYLKGLDKNKPVIYCGDLNVSHKEIDLANPKSNKKNAGFTKEEREGFSNLLSQGFIDSFRELYPNKAGQYTFWTYMGNARARNVGWRLDYFVISERLVPQLQDNIIHNSIMGSDHCPISLLMKL